MNETKDGMKSENNENLRHRTVNNEKTKTKSQINAEYFQALEQWLNDVRTYRYSCSFFGGLPYAMFTQQMNGLSSPLNTQPTNNFVPPLFPLNQNLGMFTFFNQPLPQYQHQQQQANNVRDGVQCIIPPLWKRFFAELVDFVILFIMKLAITFIAIDFLDFLDADKLQKQDKLDYKIAVELTSKMFFLEMIYRVVVCLYEGIFLQKCGATPGKMFMEIKVVLCENVEEVNNQPNVVKVFPATDIGVGWSLARSFLKNLVLALLFPICFPFFFNKFNRTTYDILCHSIVIEDRVQPYRNR